MSGILIVDESGPGKLTSMFVRSPLTTVFLSSQAATIVNLPVFSRKVEEIPMPSIEDLILSKRDVAKIHEDPVEESEKNPYGRQYRGGKHRHRVAGAFGNGRKRSH